MKIACHYLLLVPIGIFFFVGGVFFVLSSEVAAQGTETTTVTETTVTTTTTETSITQEGSAAGQLEPTPYPIDTVFTKPRQTEEIKRLRVLYQDQVEKYRELERAFYIDTAQFRQLNTLQSLEKAVVSTREVMLARTDVLITYYELIRASVEDTPGIEVTKKEQVINESINHIEALRAHKQLVANTVDRDGINARADEFEVLRADFEPTAHLAIALIVSGDIQTIYDKSKIIYADVLKLHGDHTVNALRQAERERAYSQVEREFERVGLGLLEVRTNIDSKGNITRGQYASFFGDQLEKAYSGTAQLLSYLEELIVELTE